jgi:hypothetical protein
MKMDKRFSFKKGFGQVKNKDVPAVKREIKEALGIESRYAWGKRLKGEVEPKITEVEAIETIFKKYGVTKIWGE